MQEPLVGAASDRNHSNNSNSDEWGGLPYHSIGFFYRQKFGEKIFKVPVSIATTCPNRDGLGGMKTCNFCDEWGSAAYPDLQNLTIEDQIQRAIGSIGTARKVKSFIVYFQAYTTSFSRVQALAEQVARALKAFPFRGVVIGTRPDCLSDSFLEFLSDLSQTQFVSLELGVQSFSESQLLWMRRGHTVVRSLQAVGRVQRMAPKVDLGLHLMFGSPGETVEQVRLTARLCNSLNVNNVKIHNLHVLRNTPLADLYQRGEFAPLPQSVYYHWVEQFLRFLSPKISVHRLSALSNRSEELIAPSWTSKKMEIYQGILDHVRSAGTYQGCEFTDEELLPMEIYEQINSKQN